MKGRIQFWQVTWLEGDRNLAIITKTRFRFAESLAPPAKGSLRSPFASGGLSRLRHSRSRFALDFPRASGARIWVNCLESSLWQRLIADVTCSWSYNSHLLRLMQIWNLQKYELHDISKMWIWSVITWPRQSELEVTNHMLLCNQATDLRRINTHRRSVHIRAVCVWFHVGSYRHTDHRLGMSLLNI